MAEDEPRRLELIPGDRYEIHYGIHQGTYRYEGKVADNAENKKNYPFSIRCHMFRNEKTGEALSVTMATPLLPSSPAFAPKSIDIWP